MNTKSLLSYLISAGVGLGATSAMGQFSADFETDTSANWNVNVEPDGQGRADFNFDYSTVGIPLSPNSKLGDSRRALKLEANWDLGRFTGLSVSPTGQSFTGDFVLKFDYWHNFVGPFPVGPGGTMFSGAGIGTQGTTAQWAGDNTDSLRFEASGDGDAGTADYRVYAKANQNPAFLAASSGNNSNAYYAQFGGVEAPTAQVNLYSGQTGTTADGTAGMQWLEWEIVKSGDTVEWYMNGLLMATVEDYSALGLTGENILFSRYDPYSSSSTSPNGEAMNFTLIDNISVIPEPGTYAAIFGGLALAGAFVYRRRKNRA